MFPGIPAAFGPALRQTHSMRVTVTVMDLNHNPISTITNRILDGAVNVNMSGDVSRSATLTVLDEEGQLDFDSNSPSDGAIYADRMIRIKYGIRHPGVNGGAWVDVPIFTGPVVKFTRDGDTVSIECQGKELLARGSAWRTQVYRGGTLKAKMIEDVMRQEGERFFSFATTGATLPVLVVIATEPVQPADRSIVPQTVPWNFVQSTAASMGMQLFYDGDGRLVLRPWPASPVYTFTGGNGGSILNKPKLEFVTENVLNVVKVTGKQALGKGKFKTVTHTATAPATHPLSPGRLGRNGQPRYLAEFVNDDNIGSVAECKRVADARLAAALASVVNVTADTLVVPHLDAGDYVTIKVDGYTMTQRLNSFSIPLTAGSPMTLGYNRLIGKPTRRK